MFDTAWLNALAISPVVVNLLYLLAILAGALVLLRLLNSAAQWVAERLLRGGAEIPRERQQKAHTMAGVIENTGRLLIIVTAAMASLQLIGLPIAPLLASAGVVGIAVGLAAQNLIRDYIAGFLILWENQFAVGDVIKVGEHSGTVENLGLRTTLLRNLEGAVITVPNGEIRVVSNLTRGWARVAFDVSIAYDEDVDRASEILRATAQELVSDPSFGPLIVGEPSIPGVENLGEYQVTIRILIKTQPSKQWEIAREMRARIKKAFGQAGILTPAPQRVIRQVGRELGQGTGGPDPSAEAASEAYV